MTMIIHPAYLSDYIDEAIIGNIQVFTLITVLLSGNSLISQPFAEHTYYASNDAFSVCSYHYQRAGWGIFWALIALLVLR
jgi:hypothetical protein